MKKVFPYYLLLSFLFLPASSACANPIKEIFGNATFALRAREFDRAIELYEQVLKLHPNFAPAYYYMGLAHREKNSPDSKVIELFNQTVEFDPNHIQAHEQLGKLYYTQGDFEKAEIHSLRAVELDPSLLSAKLALAWIYLLGKGEPYKAIPYFQEITKSNDAPYAHFGLGLAYAQSGQMPLVLDVITKLRGVENEYLAVQLEQMMRENRYIAPVNLSKKRALAISERQGSVIIPDQSPSTISYTPSEEKMQVRLRGAPKLSQPDAESGYETLSGEERIRQLQQRNANQPKGSY